MEIEPISATGEISAQAPPAVHVHVAQPAGPNAGSEAAQANDLAVVEQLAAMGVPLAVIQLAQEEQRLTPIDAELLLPTPAAHLPGAHEAGKGDLIDVYD
jgi:hypothetical protein